MVNSENPDLSRRNKPRPMDVSLYLEGHELAHGYFRLNANHALETNVIVDGEECILTLPNPNGGANSSYDDWFIRSLQETELAMAARETGILTPNRYEMVRLLAASRNSQRQVSGVLRSRSEFDFYPYSYGGTPNMGVPILQALEQSQLTAGTIDKIFSSIPHDLTKIFSMGISFSGQDEFMRLVRQDDTIRILLHNFSQAFVTQPDRYQVLSSTVTYVEAILHIIIMNMHDEAVQTHESHIRDMLSYKDANTPLAVRVRTHILHLLDHLELSMRLYDKNLPRLSQEFLQRMSSDTY